MAVCTSMIRVLAFCLVLLSSSFPVAATDNLWASWLRFNDTPTISNLYVDCWIGKALARSYKITKTKRKNLNLFELESGSWVLRSDASFTASYVEFNARAEGPIDVLEYFGWDSPVTESFLSYIASDIPVAAGKILQQNMRNRPVGPDGQPKLFGINLEEYVEVKDRASWSSRLNFREKSFIHLSELKVLKEGQLSYDVIKTKDFAKDDYRRYLGPAIITIENYKSSNYYHQILDCTLVN